VEAIRTEYGEEEDAASCLIRTAFALAQVTYLTIKPDLSQEECQRLPGILKAQRRLLQAFYRTTPKKARAQVPTIHLALHYEQEMALYATTYNCSVMIGEQKHKIHKAHALHTNSKDRVLQLLKSVNLGQTMRSILDKVYPDHPVAIQLNDIVDECPILRTKFLGSTSFSTATTKLSNITIDAGRSKFATARVGLPVSARLIFNDMKRMDTARVIAGWEKLYGDALSSRLKLKIEYWGIFSGTRDEAEHAKKISIRTGGFVARIGSVGLPLFYRVKRILSIGIGSEKRCFLVATRMERDESLEVSYAPYDVFQEGEVEALLSIEELSPRNIHFVARTPNTWWWNPYVTSFL
jgi:hypothetical protein